MTNEIFQPAHGGVCDWDALPMFEVVNKSQKCIKYSNSVQYKLMKNDDGASESYFSTIHSLIVSAARLHPFHAANLG